MGKTPIKLLALDFDGVLTDNKVYTSSDGNEMVCCSKEDSIGLNILQKKGIPIVVISSEWNKCVMRRCDKLGIDYHIGVEKKIQKLKDYTNLMDVSLEDTCFIGNDMNDLDCLEKVGHPMIPKDHCFSKKETERLINKGCLILSKSGGNGAVREACENLISFGI